MFLIVVLMLSFYSINRGAVVMNIFALAVIIAPSTSMSFKAGITVPVIACHNILACRVFRLLKLGFLQTSPDTFQTFTTIVPTGGIGSSMRFHTPTMQTSTDDDSIPGTNPSWTNKKGDLKPESSGEV